MSEALLRLHLCRNPGAWFRSAGAVSSGLYLDKAHTVSKSSILIY